MIELILAMALAGPPKQDCIDFEPVEDLYNRLGKCYSRHGGDRISDEETVSIWTKRNENCETARRLIVLVRRDKACVWWRSE